MAVKHYELRRRYWNGKKQFPVGHIEPFEEGTQPKSAKLVDEPELVVEEPKGPQEPVATTTLSEIAKATAPKKASLLDTPKGDK
tara:strand:+ start:960 stop:1211 length:252 start_codon:yes stop_codon:yes gene_type:complete